MNIIQSLISGMNKKYFAMFVSLQFFSQHFKRKGLWGNCALMFYVTSLKRQAAVRRYIQTYNKKNGFYSVSSMA